MKKNNYNNSKNIRQRNSHARLHVFAELVVKYKSRGEEDE